MATSMKAVVFEKVGGPEVLKVTSVPKPFAGRGEVVVRVRACALNLLDYYLRIEEDPEMPMPHILGSDIAGEIDSLGDGVEGWKAGDPVLVSSAIEVEGGRSQIVGYQTQGGYAEFAAVPARNLLRKPDCLTFEEAASMPSYTRPPTTKCSPVAASDVAKSCSSWVAAAASDRLRFSCAGRLARTSSPRLGVKANGSKRKRSGPTP